MPSKSPTNTGRRIQTRRSGVHGNGVFALADIAEGETLIEYKGEVISWKEALRRHPHDPSQPQHTFYFHIDDGHVIDGKVHGNAAKWINHSCEPNCEADETDGRVFIKALRTIHAGEELNYDYGLMIDEPYTPELLAEFPCWCGSEQCRGTLLAPKDEEEEIQRKKDKKKAKKAKEASKKAQAEKAEKKARKAGKKDKKDKKSDRD
ncbi:SET domain-containing protein [Variovorax sp. PAMC 28711]|uniref:SET domain-containing protein n=1 Tax=Variovorax sp. PAMC 28711 TaxID=1795631 RepID=UPI00078ECC90|nr:SET domain-containing protein-lysine N-methyltransferase [Variovorax sp. PAMC 28711]AMM24820.1 SET domain-containing protein-lysine N-methyltransferase [Variovorax sp. PAMC 28711]